MRGQKIFYDICRTTALLWTRPLQMDLTIASPPLCWSDISYNKRQLCQELTREYLDWVDAEFLISAEIINDVFPFVIFVNYSLEGGLKDQVVPCWWGSMFRRRQKDIFFEHPYFRLLCALKWSDFPPAQIIKNENNMEKRCSLIASHKKNLIEIAIIITHYSLIQTS